jgi:PhoPQ-activated pathogenicity-related protein
VGIAPIVIDVLNFRPQMKYQVETWGRASEQIGDYSRKQLVNTENETPREVELRQMMDPYTYRSLLALPKLIINGTNDPYWVVDATQIYWDGLIGPKYVLKLPNAAHGLEGSKPLALSTLAVFFRHTVDRTPMPCLEWKHAENGNEIELSMKSSSPAKSARLWVAQSPTKDFRQSKWRSQPLEEKSGQYLGKVEKPASGHVAVFGELGFESASLPYSLTTLVWRSQGSSQQ